MPCDGSFKHFLDAHPSSLREAMQQFVVWGVRNGMVVYDESLGLAVVQKLSGRELVALSQFEQWWASDAGANCSALAEKYAWRRAYWKFLQQHPVDMLSRLLEQSRNGLSSESFKASSPEDRLAWYRAHEEASDRWLEQRQRRDDLEFALDVGSIQEEALHSLQVDLHKLDMPMWFAAFEPGRDLALALTGTVSSPVAARVAPILEREYRKISGLRTGSVPPWFSMLVMLMASGPWLQEKMPAEFLLSLLTSTIAPSQLPARMVAPRVSDLARANKYLGSCRLRGICKEFLPATSVGGPPKTPWVAARDFAKCFEFTGIPTERDAKR